jgi:phosphoglycerate dehydrogenase-like enzyme
MVRPAIVIDVASELVRDLFDDASLARLGALGDVRHTDGSGEGRDAAEILVTGWGTTPLGEHRTDERLKLVVHSAGTIRSLVPKSLIADGVRVSHASAGMARSVSELALYFTIALLRNLQAVDRRVHNDRDWSGARGTALGSAVFSTRIGVVGASRVGRIYIEQVLALGAEVSVYDPYLAEQDARDLGVRLVGLDDLLRSSQVIALHAPVTDETRGLVTAARLASVRDGGIIINTARSAILDSAALERELVSGRLSAALDVFDEEPLPQTSALWGLANVLITPHIGALTATSRRSQGVIVIDEIERYVTGVPLANEVRIDTYDRLA